MKKAKLLWKLYFPVLRAHSAPSPTIDSEQSAYKEKISLNIRVLALSWGSEQVGSLYIITSFCSSILLSLLYVESELGHINVLISFDK